MDDFDLTNVTAGISPQFWCHIPMTVMDVHHLLLHDGIHWMAAPPPSSSSLGDNSLRAPIPVSKCLLVGMIVYADIRRDGTMAYVLDDGTGLIDCVHWSTGDAHDIYHLPTLKSGGGRHHDDDGRQHNHDHGHDQLPTRFKVGDTVRVFGRIEGVAVIRGNDGEKRDVVIHEIQATLIEPVVYNTLAVEAQHWRDSTTMPKDGPTTYLELLGPKIQSQVRDRIDLPSADDTTGSWRVFGTSCRCQLDYMDNLLYCHCQATVEPLDPTNTFRDMILRTLLTWQAACSAELVFTYKSIKNDGPIRDVATKVLQTTTSVGSSSSVSTTIMDKLFLNTFRALRHDGILHLLNDDTDEYLFITRDRVLEPVVRSQHPANSSTTTSSSSNTIQRHYVDFSKVPPYLSRIHNDRLLFINRSLASDERSKNGKKPN